MIYITKEYVICCDNCNEVFVAHEHRKSDAIKNARIEGWYIGAKHICPRCKENVLFWKEATKS